jgi:hypothetical protein
MADLRSKELMEKEAALVAEIETLLPDFARSCRGSEDVTLKDRLSQLQGGAGCPHRTCGRTPASR